MQYDSMQPQDIVEDEEKKRVNALLQRENLIRGLGIIDQLSQLLPTTDRPADTQQSGAVLSKSQVTPDCPDPSCKADIGDSRSWEDFEECLARTEQRWRGSVKRDPMQRPGPWVFTQLLTLSPSKRARCGAPATAQGP